MRKAEYYAWHRQFCDDMVTITKKKSADYTGDSDDPFANFKIVEKLGICSVEQGFLTRMSDKFIRLTNLADGREPAVSDESIQDTLHDLANYCALFAGYLESKKAKPAAVPVLDLGEPAILFQVVATGVWSGVSVPIGTYASKELALAMIGFHQRLWPADSFTLGIEEVPNDRHSQGA